MPVYWTVTLEPGAATPSDLILYSLTGSGPTPETALARLREQVQGRMNYLRALEAEAATLESAS